MRRLIVTLYRFLGPLSLATSVAACAGANLATPPTDPALKRLLNTAYTNVDLLIETDLPTPTIVGHQYLLAILPFGRVRVEDVRSYLEEKLITAGAMRGIMFNHSGEPRKTEALLKVRINSLSVSGYDLIFFRRPFADVQISGELLLKDSRTYAASVQHEKGDYTRFAFEPELQAVLDKAATEACDSLLNELRIERRAL